MEKLLVLFLLPERLAYATAALSSGDEMLSQDEHSKVLRVVSGAQKACYIWSNPACAPVFHLQPSPIVRHLLSRVISWISLFFAHPTSTLFHKDALKDASYVLDKIVYKDQGYRDALGAQIHAQFLRNIFSFWLSVLQSDLPDQEDSLYILSDAVCHTLLRAQDKGQNYQDRDALSHRFYPLLEAHPDEVAKALSKSLLARGIISNIGDRKRPILAKWMPLYNMVSCMTVYPKTFHAMLRHDLAAIIAGHLRRLSRGELQESKVGEATWTWWFSGACMMSAALLCGPSVAMQMMEARLLPSLIRLDNTTRLIEPVPSINIALSPSRADVQDNIVKTLTLICGYARLPSFQSVFRRSLNTVDRMLDNGNMVVSSEVLEGLNKIREVFDLLLELWPMDSAGIRCSNTMVRKSHRERK